MMVAILVIGYVLILRWLDQKNREKDRPKAGAMPPGPADYAKIKKALAQVSDRLMQVETEYHALAQRMGVPHWSAVPTSSQPSEHLMRLSTWSSPQRLRDCPPSA